MYTLIPCKNCLVSSVCKKACCKVNKRYDSLHTFQNVLFKFSMIAVVLSLPVLLCIPFIHDKILGIVFIVIFVLLLLPVPLSSIADIYIENDLDKYRQKFYPYAI